MCFATLILVFGLAGSTFADNIYWDGSEGSDWTDGNNWVGGNVPSDTDYGLIGDPAGTQPIIANGQTVSAQRVVVGQENSGCTLDVMTGGSITSAAVNFTVGRGDGGGGTLNISGGDVIADAGFLIANFYTTTNGTVNMTGGTLTVHADIASGNWWMQMLTIGDGGVGTFNMEGGVVTVDEDMYLAYHRPGGNPGHLNMTGGTIDVAGTIMLSKSASVSSKIQLDGGIITAGDLLMTANGSLDLAGGTMILDGDDTVAIQGYIDSGLITGYGFQGAVIMDYNGTNDETTLVGDVNFNAPPSVDAGSYQSVLYGTAVQLTPIVSDDNKPDPPATLTYTWSGPDGVSFDPCSTVEAPIAEFTAAGFYELRLSVSDSVKDACDVVTIYVRPDDDPIAHWDFEEGLGGSDVLDVNGNDGVIAGDSEPNWVSGWVEDWAMEFYASGETTVSSYVDITSNVSAADPNLDNLRYDITLSAWFKIGNLAITSSPVIVANGDLGWRLYANHGDGSIVFTPGDGVADWQNRTTSVKLLDDGYWHHVVGMYDYANSKSYLYVDGEFEAESSDHVGMMAEADDNPVSIGARWKIVEEELVAERGWNGLIDDVKVYSYCISEAQIAALAVMGDLVPQVDAGPDQAVSLQDGAVQLAGTATDDGEPNPSLAIEWSKVSGIGTVTFDPCDAAVATATFSEADTYVLRLTADDGNAEVFDEVTITVSDPTCQDVIDDGLLKASDISGPEGTPDCYVDLYDFAAFAGEWLSCNDPQDIGCESPYL